MKKKILFICSILFLGFIVMPKVSAMDINIHSGESIQAAIDSATNGDVLILEDGIYTEDLVINKELTIKGTTKQGTIIDGAVVINKNATLDTLTVQDNGSEVVEIKDGDSLIVNINNTIIKYKNYTNNDYGTASYTSGIRLKNGTDGIKLNLTNSEIYAQYALWVNSGANQVVVDNTKLTGWAALDISNGTRASATAKNNSIMINNSVLTGISYNSVHASNAYGTIVIGGQENLNLGIQNSTVKNDFQTANPLDLIVYADAYLSSKNVNIEIISSKLINTDTTDNSAVYNIGTEANADVNSGNMLVVGTDVEINSANGLVNAPVNNYITLTIDSIDGQAFMTVPKGIVMSEPEAPVVDGYTFGGWYKDKEHTLPFDFTQPLNADATIYAKLTPQATQDTNNNIVNPDTKDNILMISILTVVGLAGTVFFTKKKLANR